MQCVERNTTNVLNDTACDMEVRPVDAMNCFAGSCPFLWGFSAWGEVGCSCIYACRCDRVFLCSVYLTVSLDIIPAMFPAMMILADPVSLLMMSFVVKLVSLQPMYPDVEVDLVNRLAPGWQGHLVM